MDEGRTPPQKGQAQRAGVEESGADVLNVALLVFFVSLALVVAAMMILPAIL